MEALRSDIVILGAGPAGLSAALELLRKTSHRPVIIESTNDVGGICRSLPLGNGTIDFGGHRFHTTSQRVREFWLSVMPLGPEGFRIKKRQSKLFFQGNLFDYPVLPTIGTISQLGIPLSLRIFTSYLSKPARELRNLEDFFINTYGEQLYELFFKDYTAKIWGRSCQDISYQWARERLAGPRIFKGESNFLYPKGGPAIFWKAVADEVERLGGKILLNHKVTGINVQDNKVQSIVTNQTTMDVDHCLSTLSMGKLIQLLNPTRKINLPYRSLISVNLILERKDLELNQFLPQWIYVNHAGLKSARVQFYRAWDESMSPGPTKEIVGMEFFVDSKDELWDSSDEDLKNLALKELAQLRFFTGKSASDYRVVRYQEAYPCYWQDFEKLSEIQSEISSYQNLFSFGRQGLHRYMNMDQTIMSALRVVDHLRHGGDKAHLWEDFQDMHLPE